MKLHHLNCVKIESPFGTAIGHCLLIENSNGNLTLIDAGIGLAESQEPEKHLGKDLVEITGFQFDEALTAIRQIEGLGLNPEKVTDIICSHLDPDHIGGLVDFPNAKIHISDEELKAFTSGDDRYLKYQLSHKPTTYLYTKNDSKCFGLPSRKINLDFEAYLIPLFGHTLGHCGVAIKINSKWTFYVGDAYYLRAEIENRNHPVDQLATIRAVDNAIRLESLEKIKTIVKQLGNEISYFGYHDPIEFESAN